MATSKTSNSKKTTRKKTTASASKAAKKATTKKAAVKKAASKKKVAAKKSSQKTAARKTANNTAAKRSVKKSSKVRKAESTEAANQSTTATITREAGRYALPPHVEVELPANFKPTAKQEYMGPEQLAYFRGKLRAWREQLVEESRQTIDNLRDEVRDVGDEAERATRETENSLELRTRDRYRKLIAKIDKALRRVEDGSYGYCEETDEEIGVARLDARPIATLSLDAQERREHMEKQMRD